MASSLLVLLAVIAPLQCHSARMKSGAIMSSEAIARTSKNQCVITSREKELGLVWKFSTDSKSCRTACLSEGIYSADKRNAAFEGAFEASFEDKRCHCRDKNGIDKLPLFRSRRHCKPRVCWEFYQKLLGLYKRTNVYQTETKCAQCDDQNGPKCDDVNLGPTFSLPELKKKQQDGTLPPGTDNVVNQFVDEEEGTTTAKPKHTKPEITKPDVKESGPKENEGTTPKPDQTMPANTNCPEFTGHDPKDDSCINEETDEPVPDECCSGSNGPKEDEPRMETPVGRLTEDSLEDDEDEDVVPEYDPELDVKENEPGPTPHPEETNPADGKCPQYPGYDEKMGFCIDEMTEEEVPEKCCSGETDEDVDEEAACPAGGGDVSLDAFGTCFGPSKEKLPEKCCDHLESCDERVDDALRQGNQYLELYMTACHIQTSDFRQADDGSVSVLDDTRLCAKSCRDTMDAQRTIVADINKLQQECSDHELMSRVTRITSAVSVFRATQASCQDTPEDAGVDDSRTKGECPDLAMIWNDCGRVGSTKESCEESGCCWQPNQQKGRPWCYHSQETASCNVQCPVDKYAPQKRQDCAAFLIADDVNHPDDNVRGQACHDVGCCWQPLEHNSKHPWCFYQVCM